jgi:putative FmdB family regulatory protein
MPTYEFRCPQGHEFEKFYRSIGGAEAQAACPQCAEQAERIMSAAGFAFKGSGFYLTDYGKNAHRDKGTPSPTATSTADGGKGEGSKADVKSDTGAKSESSGSSESKSAAPAESKPAASAPPPKPSAGE